MPTVKISPNGLAIARAKLVLALGRDVQWKEFADIVGLTPATIAGIRTRRTNSSPESASKIVTACRGLGANVTLQEILEEDILQPA